MKARHMTKVEMESPWSIKVTHNGVEVWSEGGFSTRDEAESEAAKGRQRNPSCEYVVYEEVN